ncbi:hypothetical protein EDB85DRAFT_1895107 [Lactarius pseudohatsudake]|nr:hypothetical protein EDB85DRAFT_1895107 [Lactarius pseudohatsudake]
MASLKGEPRKAVNLGTPERVGNAAFAGIQKPTRPTAMSGPEEAERTKSIAVKSVNYASDESRGSNSIIVFVEIERNELTRQASPSFSAELEVGAGRLDLPWEFGAEAT